MKTRPSAARAAFSVLVSITATLAVTGCAVGTEGQEQTGSTATEALTKAGSVGSIPPIRLPPPPPPPLAFPPANPTYCPSVEPTCSVDPISWASDDDPELRALGCSHIQHWFTGNSSGLLGGLFTLCPDSAAVHAKYGTGMGVDVVSCSACVPQVPAGDIYILLEAFVGPNCESGCLTHPFNPVTGVQTGDGLGN